MDYHGWHPIYEMEHQNQQTITVGGHALPFHHNGHHNGPSQRLSSVTSPLATPFSSSKSLGVSHGARYIFDTLWYILCYIAIENGHRNSGFTHWKWWIFPWLYLFTRRYPPFALSSGSNGRLLCKNLMSHPILDDFDVDFSIKRLVISTPTWCRKTLATPPTFSSGVHDLPVSGINFTSGSMERVKDP